LKGVLYLVMRTKCSSFYNLRTVWNKHKNNGMKNLIMCYSMIVFHLTLLINVCIEFIGFKMASIAAKWLKNFLTNIPLGMKPISYVSIHCDCQSTIVIAKDKNYNGKNKHIQLRHNLVKQLLKRGTISIDIVKSKQNLADPLSKPLGRNMIFETSRRMRVVGLSSDIKIHNVFPWIKTTVWGAATRNKS